MNHVLSKTIIITKVTELIAEKYNMPLEDARNLLYGSNIIKLIEDDETGLYGDSPLYAFSLFEQEYQKRGDKI